MTASEAIQFVQSKRGIVCPNPGFRTQLEKYATRFAGRQGKGQEGGKVEGERGLRISAGIAERVRQLKAGQGDVIKYSSIASESSPEDPAPLSEHKIPE
jgi:atypical dual specificity phosphatase